jgi:hypothetical protein
MAAELSTYFESVLPELVPNNVRSFGPGGQIYSAEIYGGFNVSANTENEVFTFRRDDSSVANAKFLTNLEQAGRLGSTEEFLVTHVGLRVVKFSGAAALTSAEEAAMKNLLASAYVELGLGADAQKIGQFSGMHVMAPVDGAASDVSTVTASHEVGGAAANAFIRLRMPIPMQRNVEVRGKVKFAKAPATVLTSTANAFGFVVILYGVKVVAS